MKKSTGNIIDILTIMAMIATAMLLDGTVQFIALICAFACCSILLIRQILFERKSKNANQLS